MTADRRRDIPDDGDAALAALTDVGVVHRILDQFELIAVRTARRHGKSWAEIATRLGVTRQSAWERWRDLDNAETDRRPVLRAMLTAERRATDVIDRTGRRAARRR